LIRARRPEHGGGALLDGSTPHQFGYVIPNSGTGGLKGLAGTVLYRHDEAGAGLHWTMSLPQ